MENFIVVRGLFDGRKRQLIINENYIKFESKDNKKDLFKIINKEDISDIRYGIHFIKGLEFYIGREYQIFIKSKSGKEVKINFKLFYRRKLKEKHQLFCDIIDKLWSLYLDDMTESFLKKIEEKEDFFLCGIQFSADRIKFNNKELLFKDLEIKNYYHYFMVYSKNDHYQNKMLYYLKDDNAVIVSHLLTILKSHE